VIFREMFELRTPCNDGSGRYRLELGVYAYLLEEKIVSGFHAQQYLISRLNHS